MTVLAAGLVTALGGCATARVDASAPTALPSTNPMSPTPKSVAQTPVPQVPPPDVARRVPVPAGTLTGLPGTGRHLALTVDDGASSEVIGAYIRFARDTGARFTFFVTGGFDSWTDHKAELRPLVESGQIQLGNHTWTHADLTSLSTEGVADELSRCKRFLRNTFGVDGTPFFRPPYGYHNDTVDAVAAELGYTTPVLWFGSLSDSGLITERYLVQCARQYFHPQTVIIGHANHPPVTHVYPTLVEIIRERRLNMVTLDDYFVTRRA